MIVAGRNVDDTAGTPQDDPRSQDAGSPLIEWHQ